MSTIRRNNRQARVPQARGIDDYTGFEVPLYSLKRDWAGLLTVNPDVRNPQDFVRGIADKQNLPYSRPEAPDQFLAEPLLWEDGRIWTGFDGVTALFEEGLVVSIG